MQSVIIKRPALFLCMALASCAAYEGDHLRHDASTDTSATDTAGHDGRGLIEGGYDLPQPLADKDNLGGCVSYQ